LNIIESFKDRLKQSLSQRQKKRHIDGSRVRAAVMVPIYCKQGQLHILLIKRTETVRVHKGEISFPGGTYEYEDETLVNTALRESAEEIGLRPGDVEILGELDDEPSIATNYNISPFVGFIPWPYKFRLSPEETEEIINVPVQSLLDKTSRRKGTRTVDGKTIITYDYHYQERVIWGATARILNRFLSILAKCNLDNLC
jgi:8-oxo-dGTP pyrophosphatase MutT (NUDIX family)